MILIVILTNSSISQMICKKNKRYINKKQLLLMMKENKEIIVKIQYKTANFIILMNINPQINIVFISINNTIQKIQIRKFVIKILML